MQLTIAAMPDSALEFVGAVVNSKASYLAATEEPNMQTPIKLITAGAFDSF